MLDLLIRGGIVVARDGAYEADVGIEGGRIAGLYGTGQGPAAVEVEEARGLHVFPGLIDPHGHLRSNRKTFEESCRVMSRQMAAGGVTSFIDLSRTEGSYLPMLEDLKANIEAHSIIDMGSNPTIFTREQVEELPEVASRYGIAGVKMFPGGLGRQLYADCTAVDDGLMWMAMRACARLNPQVIVRTHSENHEIAWALEPEVRASGRRDPGVWTDCRPSVCEEEALHRVSFLAGKAGCPAYAVHLTTAAAPQIIADCWARGIRFYGETCPQYLTCHRDHPRAILAKYQPALKTEADCAVLWKGLRDGWIHTVGSDHIPLSGEDKVKGGSDDMWTVVGAMPNSGTILPVLLHYGVHEGRLGLSDVARVSSYNVARLMRLHPRKGEVRVGADADLVLVDLKKEVVVDPKLLHVDITLYDGERFVGWPVQTFARGRRVMANGDILVPPGGGRYLAGDAGPVGVL